MADRRVVLCCAGCLAAWLSVGCGEADGAAAPDDPGVAWPKRVTLSAEFPSSGESLRLADGMRGLADGDLALTVAVQLSLRGSPAVLDDQFCHKGTYAALADVPTDEQVCPGDSGGGWEGVLFLSAGTPHSNQESDAIGLSALVRNAAKDELYRLRILGDTVALNEEGVLGTGSVSFEYEPVP